MKRIGLLTSGGDAPGMNAAIRAVVRTAVYRGFEVYGVNRGYAGLLEQDFYPMNSRSVANIIDRGGTILQTSRSDFFPTNAGLHRAAEILKEYEIDVLVVIVDNHYGPTRFRFGEDDMVYLCSKGYHG